MLDNPQQAAARAAYAAEHPGVPFGEVPPVPTGTTAGALIVLMVLVFSLVGGLSSKKAR